MSLFDALDHWAQPIFHKRLIRGAVGFVTGGPTAALAGLVSGGGSKSAPAAVKFSGSQFNPAIAPIGSARDRACGPGLVFNRSNVNDPGGRCIASLGPTQQAGVIPFIKRAFMGPLEADPVFETGPPGPGGDAVMGRYGAAMVPGNMLINRSVCISGMTLGDDGLCYNRGQITNKQRAWPRGRKPLLTGGEMRAISIAATAGRRLERTTKRLQKIGLMKKPSRPRQRLITSGPTEHHHHA